MANTVVQEVRDALKSYERDLCIKADRQCVHKTWDALSTIEKLQRIRKLLSTI